MLTGFADYSVQDCNNLRVVPGVLVSCAGLVVRELSAIDSVVLMDFLTIN